MSIKQGSSRDIYLIIAVVWGVLALVVNPLGNFPLNDSWAYASNVFNLTEKGVFDLSEWPGMTLIAHMFYGSFFTSLFGFSFNILRFSTWILGLASILAFVHLLGEDESKKQKVFFAFILGFNPLFFHLSFIFHTDIPFLCLFLISLIFYQQHLKSGRITFLHWGLAFSVLATLVRQIGIGIPVAFLIYTLIFISTDRKKIIWSLFGVIVCALTLFLYEGILDYIGELSPRYGTMSVLVEQAGWSVFPESLKKFLIILFYLGLFLSPLVILYSKKIYINISSSTSLFWIWISVFVALICAYPFLPARNVIYNFGLGPVLLKETLLGYSGSIVFGKAILYLLLFVGSVSGACILILLIVRGKGLFIKDQRTGKDHFQLFALLIAGGYMVFLFVEHYFFDRYFLLLFPLVLVVIADEIQFQKWNLMASTLFLILILLYSVFATQDYFGWNRVRWDLLNKLTDQGIGPEEIDGGFEFNGWHQAAPRKEENDSISWWFVKDDKYVVGFYQLCGYEKIEEADYFSLLSMKRRVLYAQKRNVTSNNDQNESREKSVLYEGGEYIFPFYDSEEIVLKEILPCDRLKIEIEFSREVDLVDLEILNSLNTVFKKSRIRLKDPGTRITSYFTVPDLNKDDLILRIINPKIGEMELERVRIRVN